MNIQKKFIIPAIVSTLSSGIFLSFFFFFLRKGRGTYLFNTVSKKIFDLILKKDITLLTEIVEHLSSYHYIHKISLYAGKEKISRIKPVYTRKVKLYKRSFYYDRKKVGSIRILYS